jgi:outer membrane protein assembly factor BamB
MSAGIRCLALVWALVMASSAHASPADRWETWQRDAAHSGFAPDTVSMSDIGYAWSRQVHDGAIVGLAASQTAVFTTVAPNYFGNAPPVDLVAQDIASGEILWSVTSAPGASFGEPAYAGGRLYVVEVAYTSDGSSADIALVCRDAATGAQIWRDELSPPSSFFSYPLYAPTIDGGIVYVLDLAGDVHRLASISASNGATLWSVPIVDHDTRAVTVTGGFVYSISDGLAIIDPADGATLDFIAAPGEDDPFAGPRAPTVVGATAFATSSEELIAFDLASGEIASSLAIHASGQIATDGTEIFVLSAGALSVRDAASGVLHWGFEAPQTGPVNPGALSDNIVVLKSHVVVSDGISTYIVNRSTRQPELSYALGGRLAYAADKLLIADGAGNVTAFDLPSDELFRGDFE